MNVEITTEGHWPDDVERLLAGLPDWFGIEAANRAYVDEARTLPGVAARSGDGHVAGVLLLKRHFPEAAEIELLAVRADLHRHGIGRQLVDRAAADLRADRVQLLQVKTLGPSEDYEPYARTRAFYRALGFTPLEEFSQLWPSDPCLVMVKPLA